MGLRKGELEFPFFFSSSSSFCLGYLIGLSKRMGSWRVSGVNGLGSIKNLIYFGYSLTIGTKAQQGQNRVEFDRLPR